MIILRAVLVPLFFLFSLIPGCDGGLGPISEPTGFEGVIQFKHWPPPDQVLELRLVAFTEFPADSSSILQSLLGGKAVIYPPTTVGVAGALQILGNKSADTVHYVFPTDGTLLKEGTYNYVVIAWRYGPNYFADWSPAGVYTLTPGTFEPAAVIVRSHRMKKDIDITVDFTNLPPKPWR
jgi:hypothetical protein